MKLLTCVWLFVTPWNAVCQAPLSFMVSRSLLKFMSTESVMLFNHLIICLLLLLLPSVFTSFRVFSNESALHIRWPKYWSFSVSPSNKYSGLVSFKIYWFDLLAVLGTLKNLLQCHKWEATILPVFSFFMVQLSPLYMTTGQTIAFTIWVFVGKVIFLLFNTLSRFVITLLPRSNHLQISRLQSLFAMVLEHKKIKSITAFIFFFLSSICHEVLGLGATVFSFLNVEYQTSFLTLLFHPQEITLVLLHFEPSEWYHLHIWGCWYF